MNWFEPYSPVEGYEPSGLNPSPAAGDLVRLERGGHHLGPHLPGDGSRAIAAPNVACLTNCHALLFVGYPKGFSPKAFMRVSGYPFNPLRFQNSVTEHMGVAQNSRAKVTQALVSVSIYQGPVLGTILFQPQP